MNYKNILIGIMVIGLLFTVGNISAQETKDVRYYYNNLENEKQSYIDSLEKLPSALQKLVKKDRIKIEIDTGAEKLNLFLMRAKDGSYVISKEEIKNVNVYIKVKEDAINKILEAEDPILELKKASKEKEFTIKTKGFFRTLKFKIGELMLKFKK